MNEKERMELVVYSSGILSMLKECCTGRNNHRIANIMQAIKSSIQMLQDEDRFKSLDAEKMKDILKPIFEEAKNHYRQWLNMKKSHRAD